MSRLPSVDLIDRLLEYYFQNCSWITCYIHASVFMPRWAQYKTCKEPSAVTFGTVCEIIAIVAKCLPVGHPLYAELGRSGSEMHKQYHDVLLAADGYHPFIHPHFYSVDLVELLLVRIHYAMITGAQSEDMWSLCRDLVTVGTSIGLHVDPGAALDAANTERRRWAWWNLLAIERYVLSASRRLPHA
jgi:hypothetical protein